MSAAPWNRLIRFESKGSTYYGEPDSTEADLQAQVAKGGVKATVIDAPNGIFGAGAKKTDKVLPVEKLLCPLSRADVPSIRCIGLNYKKHSMYSQPINSSVSADPRLMLSHQFWRQVARSHLSRPSSSSRIPH